jgi:hypothetical protein
MKMGAPRLDPETWVDGFSNRRRIPRDKPLIQLVPRAAHALPIDYYFVTGL